MRCGRKALCLIAIASLVGSGHVSAEQQIAAGSRVRKYEERQPVRTEAPERVSEEAKDLPVELRNPWCEWEHATGDWASARPWLDEHGMNADVIYTGEVFSNLRGGTNSDDATEYRGNVDVFVTVQTEALGLWSGGTFLLYLQNGHGEGISEDHVGDVQVLSNIDAEDFTQLSEYWFEQRVFHERLRIKLGKQDANVDFGVVDHGEDFMNSSFGVIPSVPIPTFPDPALGAAAFLDPAAWMTLGVGVFDGAPDGGTSGFDTTFDGDGGTLGLAQLALRTSLVDEGWAPGTYRVGFWYHSESVEELGDAESPETFSGNHGFYLAFDQFLLKERYDQADEQGLGAFAQFGWAPEDRSRLARYVGGGLVYTGAVSRRDQDALGVGVAHARFSNRVRGLDGLTDETAVELFYKAQITPWLSVQPDLQFIVNPGGDAEDAVAGGFRFSIDL